MSQIKSLRDSAALRRHTRWASDSAQIGATSGIALIMSVGNLGGFAGPYSLGAINKRTGSVQAGSSSLVLPCCWRPASAGTARDAQQTGRATWRHRSGADAPSAMMSQGRLKRAPSTVYAWFRGLPGLRMETLQQAQDRLWGTQVRLVDYEFTKSRHLAAMRTPDLYFN